MPNTPIERPSDLGELLRLGRIRKRIGRRRLAIRAGCSEQRLLELEIGLLTAFPTVTLELLRQRLALDPIELDAYTGALWRDPPRGGCLRRECCGLRCTPAEL